MRVGRGTAGGSPAKVRVPVREILVSGVSQMLAMAFSNEALRYVSFATQVLGKSCKMVPVMIGGVAAGRAFPTSQYVQVAVVTAGVVVFNLGKPRRGGTTKWDAAAAEIADRKSRGTDAFDAALSKEKERERDLDDLFDRARNKVDERRRDLEG